MNILATNKNGFTLVELSIVLVIIGLLIGGILVGQSLIESAKINKVVTEFQQYEIGLTQFKEKYKYFPGDHPRGNMFNSSCVGPSNCIGNGDGKFNRQVPTLLYEEIANIWPHMQGAGFLNLKLPFTTDATFATTTWVAGNNFPESSYAKGTGIIIATVDGSNVALATTNTSHDGKNFLLYSRNPNLGSNQYLDNGGFMKPANAMAIDAKMDDGVANSGKVLADQGKGPGTIPPLNCFVGDNTATATYDVSYSSDADGCRLAIFLN